MSFAKHTSFIGMGAGLAFSLLCGVGCVGAGDSQESDESFDRSGEQLVSEYKDAAVTALTPNADAFVNSGAPNSNFGSATELSVDKAATPCSSASCETRALLRFKVPANTRVGAATLRLWATNETVNGPKVYLASGAWTEAGVTWNNKPSQQGSSVTDVGEIKAGQWVQYDVSSAINTQNVDKEYTFILVGDSDNGFDFYSKESAQKKPQLIINKIESQSGTIAYWNNTTIQYQSQGTVHGPYPGGTMKLISTPAANGDYEIVAFGASAGGDDSVEVDTYFDAPAMQNQGFQAIGVKGQKDKKVELWVRKNSGQTTITPPSKARSYNVVALKGASLNLGGITKSTVLSSGSPWKVPSLDVSSRIQVLAYFGDDAVEVTSFGSGKLVFNTWGFGDGDSLHMILYGVGIAPPSTLSITNHAPQGQQYVGIRASFPKS